MADAHSIGAEAATAGAFTLPLMGGEVAFVVYDAEASTLALLSDDLNAEGRRLQQLFNFFDPASELSLLNQRRRMHVSDELLFVLDAALRHCGMSGGDYDVTLGKQIMQRKAGKEVTSVGCSYRDVVIRGNHVTLAHPDVLIDLGSIAKGYIVDRLGAWLREQGVESFFIDGRGDMLAAGEHEEEVVIQHPRARAATLAPFTLKDGAVATSGDYKQYHGSHDKSHILRQKDLISVTVVASTLMEADAFASVVFLADAARREAIIAAHPSHKVCTIDKELRIRQYNGFGHANNDTHSGSHDAEALVMEDAA